MPETHPRADRPPMRTDDEGAHRDEELGQKQRGPAAAVFQRDPLVQHLPDGGVIAAQGGDEQCDENTPARHAVRRAGTRLDLERRGRSLSPPQKSGGGRRSASVVEMVEADGQARGTGSTRQAVSRLAWAHRVSGAGRPASRKPAEHLRLTPSPPMGDLVRAAPPVRVAAEKRKARPSERWRDAEPVRFPALCGNRVPGPLASAKELLDPRSFTIATFALCGFANLSSIGIQIGGIGALAPNKKQELARLGFRAMLAGTMANLMSASIAGILLT